MIWRNMKNESRYLSIFGEVTYEAELFYSLPCWPTRPRGWPAEIISCACDRIPFLEKARHLQSLDSYL
jgi:hypothetical protein